MTAQREPLEIPTDDGVAAASVHGGGGAPRPGVLLFPDAFGVRPAIDAMAERLAALGYVVLVPNVFYRAGAFAPFDPTTAFTVPAERERLMALIGSITPDRVARDSGAYLAALAARRDVRADRIGVTGYCMGGRMAYLTAAFQPDRVRAAAAFHAGRLVTDQPDSPHTLAPRIKATLYFGVADSDGGCTPEQQGALATALAAADVEYRIELYKGKRHGFAVSDNAGVYDATAAERHWRRLEEFFGETLAAD